MDKVWLLNLSITFMKDLTVAQATRTTSINPFQYVEEWNAEHTNAKIKLHSYQDVTEQYNANENRKFTDPSN